MCSNFEHYYNFVKSLHVLCMDVTFACTSTPNVCICVILLQKQASAIILYAVVLSQIVMYSVQMIF